MDKSGSTSIPKRRKTPKAIAVIDADCCTGCAACCEVCPVDCISLIRHAPGVLGIDVWCEVDGDRCVGCQLCIHLPRKKANPFQLKICPWDAIEMICPQVDQASFARHA